MEEGFKEEEFKVIRLEGVSIEKADKFLLVLRYPAVGPGCNKKRRRRTQSSTTKYLGTE
jgi:hypothetical protein